MVTIDQTPEGVRWRNDIFEKLHRAISENHRYGLKFTPENEEKYVNGVSVSDEVTVECEIQVNKMRM